MALRSLCLLLFWGLMVSAWAAPQAVVDAVQMPAWLDRDGRVLPLAPGLEVKSGDRLRTGEGARAYVKLAEGSTVKLGESAQLTFRSEPVPGFFKAALDVAAGAFRFTTSALQKLRKRDVAIKVGTATIGIRGTDVWGKSGKNSDLVMLIEGHVEVTPALGAAFDMTEPRTVFTAPKGGAAAPLTTANDAEFNARARETDIWPGDGAARLGGRWSLLLGDAGDENSALELYDRARNNGYAARIKPQRNESGAYEYQVRIPGFVDETEANASAVRTKALLEIDAKPIR